MTRQIAIAGDRYAAYLCDKCDKPIGQDGTVTLTSQKPIIVASCWCAECWAPRAVPA